MRRILFEGILILFVALLPGFLAAQDASEQGATAQDAMAQADALYEQGGLDNLLKSAELYAQILESDPGSYDAAWKAYLPAVVQENMGKITNNPFLYYLPPESDPEFDAKYERQVEAATTAVGRGIQKNNMLAFGSPASARMADMIEVAFKDVPADTLEGVRILFIGEAADNDRVRAVLAPTGAEYVFIEAK